MSTTFVDRIEKSYIITDKFINPFDVFQERDFPAEVRRRNYTLRRPDGQD